MLLQWKGLCVRFCETLSPRSVLSHFIRVFLISAILPFLSGKVLTNVKMHVERKVFSKDKLLLQGHQVPSVNSAAGLALVFLLMYYF